MLALGLDTSCYTTSCALCAPGGEPVQARRLLPVPAGERGLRQSEAVFAHVRQLGEMLPQLMENAPEPVSCVCASAAPRDGEDSYMPVFQVGLSQGRGIAAALGVPFFSTTHQRGHLAAARWGTELNSDAYLGLHLSGGTTDVLLARGEEITLLGTSLDLHAGQLVDRIGVKMGLPFPAGPFLEELARKGVCGNAVPVSMEGLSCHLSGAEARLLRMLDAGERKENAAADETGVSDALLFGGVISSALLREMLLDRNEKRRTGLKMHFGRKEYSGDNAVGVALIGLQRLEKEKAHGDSDGR